MSTAGLRKVGHYEETLNAALKDEQHIDGVINPYLANAATRIINNPEFQRVKDRMQDDLVQQERLERFGTHGLLARIAGGWVPLSRPPPRGRPAAPAPGPLYII